MKTLELNKLDVNSPDQRKIKLNTGLKEKPRKNIVEGLNKLLADSYCLMLMSQNYHWNVQGANFRDMHLMTEEHYRELFEAVDEIAERVRALGHLSIGSMKAFNDITSINIPNGELSQQEMVADLLEGHETVVRTARSVLDLAGDAKDEVTVDLLTERMNHHEKVAWMLRSMLER
ncbi:MAG: Dps family protein [Salibacteraceae bacterium]